MMCQAGFGSPRRRGREVHVLLRHVRRRLRRPATRATAPTPSRRTARTPRTRRSRRPSSTTRCASTASRSSRTPRGPAGFRGGLGLRKDYLFDRRRRSPILADRDQRRAVGRRRRARGAGRGVRLHPRRRRDAARLEDDARPRARRRDQRPHLRRRRLRPARGARPGARAARRAARARSAPSGRATCTASRSTDGAGSTRRRRPTLERAHERPRRGRHRRHVHRRDADRRGERARSRSRRC